MCSELTLRIQDVGQRIGICCFYLHWKSLLNWAKICIFYVHLLSFVSYAFKRVATLSWSLSRDSCRHDVMKRSRFKTSRWFAIRLGAMRYSIYTNISFWHHLYGCLTKGYISFDRFILYLCPMQNFDITSYLDMVRSSVS